MIDEDLIKLLLQDLKINERPEVYSGTAKALKPDDTIRKLVEIGHYVVPILIEELKIYRQEEELHYYAQYIVDILGEIGDIRAIEILEKIFGVTDDEIQVSAAMALGKIGKPIVSYFLEKINSKGTDDDIFNAMWAFEHLTEKNADVLDFAKQIAAQHKDDFYKASAILLIGKNGSSKEVPFVEEFLVNEDSDSADEAKNALKNLLKDNPAKLREILLAHNIVGRERCEKVARKLEWSFKGLGFKYNSKEKLQGENSDELNEAVREYFAIKTSEDTIETIIDFTTDEGIIGEEEREKLYEVKRNLFQKENVLFKNYSDVISLYDYNLRDSLEMRTNESMSYKGLYPVPYEIKEKIKEFFSSKKFQTNDATLGGFWYANYVIIARENQDKSCIVSFTKTEGKKKYGNVQLKIIGKAWDEKEISLFRNMFWSQFKDLQILT